MSFANLKVGERLGLGFGMVLVMMSLIAMVGISKLSGVNDITNRIVAKDWNKAVIANEVGDMANDNARASYELFLLADKAAIDRTLER
ncbi:MAG: MCP four helix bundle domain-containing protein, partial [Gallionella sp.]|nr:MCP four helix bundle domain-containing protein [Gallionella sp.]